MKFIDKINIIIISGNGGNGLLFLYKKKNFYIKKNNNKGGNGGNIWAIADNNLNNLNSFNYNKIYKSKNGENSYKLDCSGKNSNDIYIKMPIGTIIKEIKNKKYLGDLIFNKQKILLAKGGKGGKNQYILKKNITKINKKIIKGKKGEFKKINLELIILANIGLLGLPNVGKSTFLSIITNANPKISNYPFTTLNPKLGIINIINIKNKKKKINILDIPGLIKNSSKGKGLGINFLKHLQRVNLIFHMINLNYIKNSKNIIKSLQIIKELKIFNINLYKKNRWLIFNKIDLIFKINQNLIINKYIIKFNWKSIIYKISSLKYKKITNLLVEIYKFFYI